MEKWTQWKPLPNLAHKYLIENVNDHKNGLSIILSEYKNESVKLHLEFEGIVESYTKTDETFIGSTLSNLENRYGGSFYGDWTFFKVENSSSIRLLSEQSYGIADSRDLMHFSILAIDSMLDIITGSEPKITLIHT